MMKRAALYLRVSTLDQHPETQLYDLRGLAQQRGFEIVQRVHRPWVSAAPAPAAPPWMKCWPTPAAGSFDVVVVWACDRLARSVRHFLEVLDELSHLNIEFVSFREQLDTGGPLGRAVVIIISRRRRTGTQPDRRAGPGRHAPRQTRRPAYRTQAAGHRSRRGTAPSRPWPKPHPDRQELPDLAGHRQPPAETGQGGILWTKTTARLELGRRLLAAVLSYRYGTSASITP